MLRLPFPLILIGLSALPVGLLGFSTGLPTLRAQNPPADPAGDKSAASKWKREAAAFQALPPESQRRIRQLDRELREEDSESRDRYLRLLQRYGDWYDRLPAEDRAAIESAPSIEAKIARIREIKERQWIASLPKADRDLILDPNISAEERRKRIAAVKARQEQDQLDWAMTAARLEERQDNFRNELIKWREQILEKMDPKDRRQRMNEWKNVRQPGVARSMYLESKRLGVPVPKSLENLRFPERLPPVDLVRLRQFLINNENIRAEFEARLLDPEKRDIALQELIERYWEAHAAELEAIRARDERLNRERRLKPANP
ncbi:MAG: hypothetical protein NZM31_03945 [Gemmatales bacterium]|nr:hypothetical protein [Gemmatales bacterium]MDW8386151.1 hypothetical protein [Gemmatales bacterium]